MVFCLNKLIQASFRNQGSLNPLITTKSTSHSPVLDTLSGSTPMWPVSGSLLLLHGCESLWISSAQCQLLCKVCYLTLGWETLLSEEEVIKTGGGHKPRDGSLCKGRVHQPLGKCSIGFLLELG